MSLKSRQTPGIRKESQRVLDSVSFKMLCVLNAIDLWAAATCSSRLLDFFNQIPSVSQVGFEAVG